MGEGSANQLHKYLVSYPDTESASFSKDIALHAEFYPDRMARGNANVARGSANVARGNDDNDESTTWFPHQRLIARYISHLTLYDSLGVFHDVGTGKTGVAIAVMEGLRKTNNVRRVLFLANNETILANLQNELIRKSSSIRMAAARRYPSFRRDGTSGRQLTPREWKLVFSQEHITFDTYEQFAADMEKRRSAGTLTDKLLFEQYRDSFIVMDEAHHLHFPTASSASGRAFFTILHFLRLLGVHRRLLIMTATPARDQPEEIWALFILLLSSLPNLLQQPNWGNEQAFRQHYFREVQRIAVLGEPSGAGAEVTLPILDWRSKHIQRELYTYIRGRVSFLRARPPTGIHIQYEGVIEGPMQHLPIVLHTMSDFQSSSYLPLFQKRGDVYKEASQASLFVFPDGSTGITGFHRNVNWDRTRPHEIAWQPDAFGEGNLDTILHEMDVDERIEFLGTYSATYSALFDQLFPRQSTGDRLPFKGISYVFCNVVQGCGVMLLTLLMQSFFGFQILTREADLRGDVKTPRLRAIVLNDLFGVTPRDIQVLLAYMNDPSNAQGEYCQVLLSTNKTKEGISVMNVQQIHILTPSWNFADIVQAIGRGIRAGSHRELIKARSAARDISPEDVTIRISLHCAVPVRSDVPDLPASLDFQKLLRSEIKDHNLRLLARFLLQSSWDCIFHLERHTPPAGSVDKSRDCDYTTCSIECFGDNICPLRLSNAAWIEHYGESQQRQLYVLLRRLVFHKTIVEWEEAYRYCVEHVKWKLDRPFFDVAIRRFVTDRWTFLNARGQSGYLAIACNGTSWVLSWVDHFAAILPIKWQTLTMTPLRFTQTSCQVQGLRTGFSVTETYLPWLRRPHRFQSWFLRVLELANKPTITPAELAPLVEMCFSLETDFNKRSSSLLAKEVIHQLVERARGSEGAWKLLLAFQHRNKDIVRIVPENAANFSQVQSIVCQCFGEQYSVSERRWSNRMTSEREVVASTTSAPQASSSDKEIRRRLFRQNRLGFYAVQPTDRPDNFLIRDIRGLTWWDAFSMGNCRKMNVTQILTAMANMLVEEFQDEETVDATGLDAWRPPLTEILGAQRTNRDPTVTQGRIERQVLVDVEKRPSLSAPIRDIILAFLKMAVKLQKSELCALWDAKSKKRGRRCSTIDASDLYQVYARLALLVPIADIVAQLETVRGTKNWRAGVSIGPVAELLANDAEVRSRLEDAAYRAFLEKIVQSRKQDLCSVLGPFFQRLGLWTHA